MAKLTAPLFSFTARAQLGKALVFFPWKGINAVRQYVIPANPQTTAQTVQRGFMTDAVGAFHTANYTAPDMVAWNRAANTIKDILSGFNLMVRLYIEERLLAGAWHPVSQIEVDTATPVGFDVDVEDSDVGQTFRAAIGTRPTHFPVQVALVDDADGTYSLTWAAGVAATKYYVKVQEQVGANWRDRSGIYTVTTTG